MFEGIFPASWKRQKLVLLPKAGKPPGKPTSYRPICLLDTVGKMLERVIYNRLLPVVESQGGLSDRQYGFRKARSTIDAIKMVTGLAENAIHGRGSTSKYCIVVTLDVRNAFNSANWNLIRESLAKIGVPAYLAAIYKNGGFGMTPMTDPKSTLSPRVSHRAPYWAHCCGTSCTTMFLIFPFRRKPRWWATPMI